MTDFFKRPRNLILTGACVLTTGVALHASVHGWTAQKPDKSPLSIREGSHKGPLGSGHRRTRYFVGGGLHRGK